MAGGDQRDAAAGSRIVIVAVLQFAVVGLLALAIVAITTGIASRRVGQREAIANARTTTVLKAQSVVAPAITEGVRRGDPEALAERRPRRARGGARRRGGAGQAVGLRRAHRVLRRSGADRLDVRAR